MKLESVIKEYLLLEKEGMETLEREGSFTKEQSRKMLELMQLMGLYRPHEVDATIKRLKEKL